MQNVIAGVSGMNTDSMLPAVGEPQQELLGAVGRCLARDDARGGQREFVCERRTQIARQVGHRRRIGDAAAVNPAKDLAGVKALVAARVEGRLELGAFEIGEIERGGAHGISRISEELARRRFYHCETSGHAARAGGVLPDGGRML